VTAHLAVMRTSRRRHVMEALRRAKIGCDVHYPVPDHRQPVLAAELEGVELPVTEAACGEVVSLPCFPELTESELGRVCDVLSSL